MMLKTWAVTYDIATPESSEFGDTAETGEIASNLTLRQAYDKVFETRTSLVSGFVAVEANCGKSNGFRWISVFNGAEYMTGAIESRSIHFPDGITDSSRQRLFNLMCT